MDKNILFDVHGHPQFLVYDGDRDAVIRRAQEAGVKMIAVGTQFSTSRAAIDLSRQYPEDVWAAVGYHPGHSNENSHHDKKEQRETGQELFDIGQFRKLAGDEKVVAIGECGLDYFRLPDNFDADKFKKNQEKVFQEQFNLALDLKKPLMVHCRPSNKTQDSYLDLMDLVGKASLDLPVILHFYAGLPEITKKFVDRGFYFTFGGVITFSDDYNESIESIPVERIMLETDCPYVAPKSRRGKRNEPAFVVEVAQKMAKLKKLPLDSLIEKLRENVNGVFKIF